MRQIFDLDTRLGRRVNAFITVAIVLIGLGVVAVPSGLLASALYKHDSQTA